MERERGEGESDSDFCKVEVDFVEIGEILR